MVIDTGIIYLNTRIFSKDTIIASINFSTAYIYCLNMNICSPRLKTIYVTF